MNRVLFALCALSIVACQKSNEVAPDTNKVNFNISSPSSGQNFKIGDTVQLSAAVDYLSELHGYQVKIEDTATGTSLFDDAEHVHGDHFNIADYWVATQAGGLKLSITVTVDHEGNTARKDLYFSVRP